MIFTQLLYVKSLNNEQERRKQTKGEMKAESRGWNRNVALIIFLIQTVWISSSPC